MDDHASIEWFRNYFKLANMDAFEMIDKAIDVAAHDYPDQFRFQKYRIAQRLFSGTLSSSTWDFAPPVEVSDENSVINSPVLEDIASNPNCNDGGRFESTRPRLIVRIKTKRNYNQNREAQGESSANSCVKDKADPASKKRESRKDRKVTKSAKKRKLSCETELLSGKDDGEQFPASIRKITKIRFVHGFH